MLHSRNTWVILQDMIKAETSKRKSSLYIDLHTFCKHVISMAAADSWAPLANEMMLFENILLYTP